MGEPDDKRRLTVVQRVGFPPHVVDRTAPARRAPDDLATSYVLESTKTEPQPSKPSELLEQLVVKALRTVKDPEIPVNIYDLGLVYSIDVQPEQQVLVAMTLTAPGCPVAGSLVKEVHERVLGVEGVRGARTELVWDPPWTQDRMTEAARLELGLL